MKEKTKPFAWKFRHGKNSVSYSAWKPKDGEYIEGSLIPLYTTPQTKPLSDEEIAEIWKGLWQGGNIGHIAYTYARAIEERHGIK